MNDKVVVQANLNHGRRDARGFVTFLPEYPVDVLHSTVLQDPKAARLIGQVRSYDFWLGRVSDEIQLD
jgi:hypothetical protein